MVRFRSPSADLDERRRHAEAFVRTLPPVPEYRPLTDEERAGIEAAVRHFTMPRSHRWHGRLMWARSPSEFDKLVVGAPDLLAARGDRIARRVSVVGGVVLPAVHLLLWRICRYRVLCWVVGIPVLVRLIDMALSNGWFLIGVFAWIVIWPILGSLEEWLRPERWSRTTSRPRIALDLVGTTVPEHLVAAAAVPLLTGPQAQGDLLVVPAKAQVPADWRSVPPAGVRLVHGEATGNTHWLHRGFDSPDVTWRRPDEEEAAADPLVVAYLRVPRRQSALLIHTDEHGANGIGPGKYVVKRKRQIEAVTATSRPADEFVPVPQVRPRPRTTYVVD